MNRGWLAASHRKLDVRASTATMPVHTHREADAQPLESGKPTPMRIEVFPFEHVFRAGSRIRLIIDTPIIAEGMEGAGMLFQATAYHVDLLERLLALPSDLGDPGFPEGYTNVGRLA